MKKKHKCSSTGPTTDLAAFRILFNESTPVDESKRVNESKRPLMWYYRLGKVVLQHRPRIKGVESLASELKKAGFEGLSGTFLRTAARLATWCNDAKIERLQNNGVTWGHIDAIKGIVTPSVAIGLLNDCVKNEWNSRELRNERRRRLAGRVRGDDTKAPPQPNGALVDVGNWVRRVRDLLSCHDTVVVGLDARLRRELKSSAVLLGCAVQLRDQMEELIAEIERLGPVGVVQRETLDRCIAVLNKAPATAAT